MYIILSYANIYTKDNTMQYTVLYFNIYLTFKTLVQFLQIVVILVLNIRYDAVHSKKIK
jgi:hypothetical protein